VQARPFGVTERLFNTRGLVENPFIAFETFIMKSRAKKVVQNGNSSYLRVSSCYKMGV
jgi:hypothetical protein